MKDTKELCEEHKKLREEIKVKADAIKKKRERKK